MLDRCGLFLTWVPLEYKDSESAMVRSTDSGDRKCFCKERKQGFSGVRAVGASVGIVALIISRFTFMTTYI